MAMNADKYAFRIRCIMTLVQIKQIRFPFIINFKLFKFEKQVFASQHHEWNIAHEQVIKIDMLGNENILLIEIT